MVVVSINGPLIQRAKNFRAREKEEEEIGLPFDGFTVAIQLR